MLLRLRVVGTETLSPDLRDPTVRLYEWEPKGGWKVTEAGAGTAASRSVGRGNRPQTHTCRRLNRNADRRVL
jgi:hypothetical protein